MAEVTYYDYEFTGRVVLHRLGTLGYRVVFLPDALATAAPFIRKARLRFQGEIHDHPLSAAWQSAGHGRKYVMLGKALLKRTGLSLGDEAEVRFRLVDDDDVELPPELAEALQRNARARRGWAKLLPGRRRGLAHLIAAAKTAPTRAKRLTAALDEALTGVASLPVAPGSRGGWAEPPARRTR